MTWGEFKRWMDAQDTVTDDSVIWFFDFCMPYQDGRDLRIRHDCFSGGVAVCSNV